MKEHPSRRTISCFFSMSIARKMSSVLIQRHAPRLLLVLFSSSGICYTNHRAWRVSREAPRGLFSVAASCSTSNPTSAARKPSVLPPLNLLHSIPKSSRPAALADFRLAWFASGRGFPLRMIRKRSRIPLRLIRMSSRGSPESWWESSATGCHTSSGTDHCGLIPTHHAPARMRPGFPWTNFRRQLEAGGSWDSGRQLEEQPRCRSGCADRATPTRSPE